MWHSWALESHILNPLAIHVQDSDERESAPSDPVRKTRAQRNKQARFKEEQRQREAEKQQKARENELYRYAHTHARNGFGAFSQTSMDGPIHNPIK